MPKTLAWVALLALALAAPARSEDERESDAGEPVSASATEAQPPAPRRTIRVLQNPYDLASYYRSSQDPWDGPRSMPGDPYALASFYRSDRRGPLMPPWAAFWATGYAARPSGYVGYRHSIGENGELFLAVPFLAPVGPLSGAFFGY